jgi:hypothetical protein
MAEDTAASVISFYQVPEAKAKTGQSGAARAKSQVAPKRKRRKAKAVTSKAVTSKAVTSKAVTSKAVTRAEAEPPESESFIPAEYMSADWAITESSVPELPAEPSVPQAPAETPHGSEPVMPRRRQAVPILLLVAALALGGAGITMNGWFARSLGSSDVASWLFLAIGASADLVALAMPTCAASLWRGGHRATSLVGWSVWLMTFVFAVTSGIGFASTNITEVTLARASRVTPAVVTAQSALADAMAARDRECRGGVGKFCREREAAVVERRQILDSAMASVEQTADPQTSAAIKVVSWVSHGTLRPAAEDFVMLRLVLLALLPQIGGILLMVGRLSRP